MRRILFTGLSFFFATQALLAQREDSLEIRKIADEVLVHGRAYDNLRTLTKQVGGRLNGSPQTYKAEAWAQKALVEAGADKVYLQACKIPHWVRGGKAEVRLMTGKHQVLLEALALGNSVGTGPEAIRAPVILINNFDELEMRKNEIKGTIVFYNYHFDDRFVRTFLAYGEAVVYRAMGASRAAKYGALAVLVRSMTSATNNMPHTGAMGYNDSFPKIPSLAIGLQDADRLAQTISTDPKTHMLIKTNAHVLADTTGYNVIGEWKGSQFPDQYILVGGHLDSWDPAEGAQDDGAGCVHAIEVLRALKAVGYHPRHTIRVVLFTDEENSGSGSAKYAADAMEKKETHIFALESDAGGFTPRAFSVGLPADRLAKIQPWAGLLKDYGVYEFVPGFGGADVEPLNTTLGTPVAELLPDSQRYFDYHHSAGDLFESVNKRELELGAINMTALIYLVDKYGL